MPKKKQERLCWEAIRRSRRWSAAEGRWVVDELRRSGLSAKQFAEEHEVSVGRVYQWCTRLRREERRPESRSNVGPALLEVKLPGKHPLEGTWSW